MSPRNPVRPSGPPPFLSWKDALRASARPAAVLFLLSAAFAILFNAFYVDGIELKFKTKPKTGLHPAPTPVAYEGLGKGSSKKAPSPSSAADPFLRLSLQGALDRLNKKACVFLDARKPEEYQEGHIPGALNFYGNELDLFAPQVLPQLPQKDQEIVTYCHGGDCDLSLMVSKALKEAGYTRLEIFQDGWPAWTQAGYPVQTGAAPGAFTPKDKSSQGLSALLNDKTLTALSLVLLALFALARTRRLPLGRLEGDSAGTTLLRLACGLLLAGASLDKVGDPLGFLHNIQECYSFLPKDLMPLAAVVIPWLELFAGTALILGFRWRAAALLFTVLMLVYTLAITWDVLHGIDCACGCFDKASAEKMSWWTVGRDLLFFTLGTLTLLSTRTYASWGPDRTAR